MPNIFISETTNCDPCLNTTTVDPCIVDTGCPVKLDTECTIYNKFGLAPSGLINLSIPNGTDLKTILEAFDARLGILLPYNFPAYNSSCINYPGYVISSMTDFLNIVDNEFCSVKTSLGSLTLNVDTYISNLTTIIDGINHPNLIDSCGLNFQITDSLKDLIVKLKDGYCSLSNNTYSDTSPVFNPSQSSTVAWINGGTKNHAPSAIIRKSGFSGNNLQILADGLYVGDVLSSTQILSYNPGLRQISLSGGGGTLTLPVDNDIQTLALDSITKRLTISNGNFVDLTPAIGYFTQTSIVPNNTPAIALTATGTANTNISASLQISTIANNSASILSDGLYVGAVDEKVKAASIGVTRGYLVDKLNAVATPPLSAGFAFNNTSDKVDLTLSINEATLLNDISLNSTLTASLYTIIKNNLCFRFKIVNTDTTASTFSYQDCSGTIFTGVAISASSTVTIFAKGALPGTNLVYVYNLGLNF